MLLWCVCVCVCCVCFPSWVWGVYGAIVTFSQLSCDLSLCGSRTAQARSDTWDSKYNIGWFKGRLQKIVLDLFCKLIPGEHPMLALMVPSRVESAVPAASVPLLSGLAPWKTKQGLCVLQDKWDKPNIEFYKYCLIDCALFFVILLYQVVRTPTAMLPATTKNQITWQPIIRAMGELSNAQILRGPAELPTIRPDCIQSGKAMRFSILSDAEPSAAASPFQVLPSGASHLGGPAGLFGCWACADTSFKELWKSENVLPPLEITVYLKRTKHMNRIPPHENMPEIENSRNIVSGLHHLKLGWIMYVGSSFQRTFSSSAAGNSSIQCLWEVPSQLAGCPRRSGTRSQSRHAPPCHKGINSFRPKKLSENQLTPPWVHACPSCQSYHSVQHLPMKVFIWRMNGVIFTPAPPRRLGGRAERGNAPSLRRSGHMLSGRKEVFQAGK